MKIIILGAGQVGGTLAEALIAEKHDITLIDISSEPLKELEDRLDIRTINGHGSYPHILREAGADNADMIVAVTDSDEANMVACQVAYSLFHIPTKIARIRSPHYFISQELFGKENMPIDVFISPEQLVTNNITQLIMHPGALQVLEFGNGLIKLAAVKPYYGGVLVGRNINSLQEYLPDIKARIVAIFRNDCSIPLEESTTVEIGDEVFFTAASEDIDTIISAFRRTERAYKRIIIAGGGNIGYRLAATLQNDYQIKLIELSRKRCEYLAEKLDNVTVLCGKASDDELLLDENIEHTDVFIALTNDDEANIIASIQAKKLGVKQTMTLITRTTYIDLIEGGSINIAISPQQATTGAIITHLRKGDIQCVYSLRRGAAEVIVAVARGDKKTSNTVGRLIKDINFPKGTTVGGIIRGDTGLIPTEDDIIIEADDHVILFVSDKKSVPRVEKLFQVSPGFF